MTHTIRGLDKGEWTDLFSTLPLLVLNQTLIETILLRTYNIGFECQIKILEHYKFDLSRALSHSVYVKTKDYTNTYIAYSPPLSCKQDTNYERFDINQSIYCCQVCSINQIRHYFFRRCVRTIYYNQPWSRRCCCSACCCIHTGTLWARYTFRPDKTAPMDIGSPICMTSYIHQASPREGLYRSWDTGTRNRNTLGQSGILWL